MKPAPIDHYIEAAAPQARKALRQIRAIVRRVVPDAEETIGYQMPAFRRDRIFIYFAAFKKHIGIYPPVQGSATLLKSIERFRGPKGNLQFPLCEPMPHTLIEKVVRALARQYAGR